MLDERERDDARETPPHEETAKVEATPRKGRLHNALRRARLNESERSDVILDMREAESTRLEMLYDSLSDVFDEIPPGTDLLEGTLVPGSPPRLWVDVLAYVGMGRDKRTFRFVKETRYGPKVILETSNLEEMADSVVDYVAHRLLERARALESDTTEPAVTRQPAVSEEPAATLTPAERPFPAAPAAPVERRTRFGWLGVVVAMLVGALIGAVALFSYGYYLVTLGQ